MREELIAKELKLDKKIAELKEQRNDVLQQLADLTAVFTIGQRVICGGDEHEITDIKPGRFVTSRPRYRGKKIKKDGTLGALERELYSKITPIGDRP